MKAIRGFPFLGVVIAAALIAAAVLFWERREKTEEAGLIPPPAKREGLRAEKHVRKEVRQESGRVGRKGQRFAVLIDDLGYDLPQVKAWAALKAPIAFAILPGVPYTAEADALFHSAGKEILLHLPMEPLSYPVEDPGPGALFVDMDKAHLRQRLEAALRAVPHARGVNNHMGSRFMSDDAGLTIVMEILAQRGLFFVDSRTTAATRGQAAAARAGVPFAARGLFIDHQPGYEAALQTLLKEPLQGRTRGDLLLIGHPHAGTLQALQEALPRWEKEGGRLVPLSMLVRVPMAGAKGANQPTGDQDIETGRKATP